MDIHATMLPQILYGLQNMELFHHVEKRLLQARGLLGSVVVRAPAFPIDPSTAAHIDALNRKVLREIVRNNLT